MNHQREVFRSFGGMCSWHDEDPKTKPKKDRLQFKKISAAI
jgi:hypothetical protein